MTTTPKLRFKDLAVNDRFVFNTLAGWYHECIKISARKYRTVEAMVQTPSGKAEPMVCQVGSINTPVLRAG